MVSVYLLSRIATIAVVLLTLPLSSCDTHQPVRAGFVISLLESGEPVLTDEHIATYVWEAHRIVLTPKGVARWESFAKFDRSVDPPIPKLGELTKKEFVVTLDGSEMYRGHFWSMALSLLKSGVLLYDTSGANRDQVWITFTRAEGTQEDDPRARPEIEAYFRAQGKLE